MKKISEKENDIKKEFSQEIKITDKEIRRNYYISLILVIITPLIIAFVWYLYFIESLYFYLILFGMPIGILIEFCGLYGIIMYRLTTEKTISKEDKDLKRNYYKSLLMVIFTPIIAILAILYLFTGISLGFLSTIPIGIAICLYGLYGIYSYKFKPVKYKEAIKNGKNRRIKYYLFIAISLPILIVSSWYLIMLISYGFEYIFWNLHWLILFILSLICFVLGIYKSIHERRT